jgi:hypothetical protein
MGAFALWGTHSLARACWLNMLDLAIRVTFMNAVGM